jgi:hypothetical protein
MIDFKDSCAGLQPATETSTLTSEVGAFQSLESAPVLSQSFARISPDISELTLNLTPCARRLYEWLLQQKRSGVAQEVFLEEFAATTANRRRGGYSLAHIKRSLKELLETELVQEVVRYSAKIFKLIAHDSRTFLSHFSTEMSKELTKMSKKEPSKPYPAVGLNRENQRNNPDPIQRPVEVNRKAGLVMAGEGKDQPELKTANPMGLIEEVEATLEQPLSTNLQQMVLSFTICRVRDALDSYREAQRQPSRIRDPLAWFAAALQRAYKPNRMVNDSQAGESRGLAAALDEPPRGFGEWFALAQRAEVAECSGFVDGVFGVYTRQGWEPWTEVQQVWPLAKLRSVLATRVVTRTVDEPVAVVQEPTTEERLDPVRRAEVLARLKAKVQLPWLKAEAKLLAKAWGFEVTEAGIFEGVGCG